MKIQFRELARPHSKLIFEAEIDPGMPTPNNGEVVHFAFDRFVVKFREFRFDGNNPMLTISLALEPEEEPKPKSKEFTPL